MEYVYRGQDQSPRQSRGITYWIYRKDSEYRRVRAQRGKSPGYGADVWREMADLSWLALRLPEKFGGIEASFSQTVLLLEQMGRGLVPEPLTAVALLAGGAILYGDNEALKLRLLPRHIRHIEVIEQAQRHQRRNALAIGGNLVQGVATVVFAIGLTHSGW